MYAKITLTGFPDYFVGKFTRIFALVSQDGKCRSSGFAREKFDFGSPEQHFITDIITVEADNVISQHVFINL